MPFSIEQDKFLIEAYYRSGEKIAGTWMYDIRSAHSEFYKEFPQEEQIDYDIFAQYVRRLVSRFKRSGGVCKNVPRRRASKVTDECLRDLQEILRGNPAQSIREISRATGLSYGSSQKALRLISSTKADETELDGHKIKEIMSYLEDDPEIKEMLSI